MSQLWVSPLPLVICLSHCVAAKANVIYGSQENHFLGELHAVCNYKWGWAWSLPTVPAPMPQHTHTHTHIHTSPNGSTSQTRPVCSHNSTLEAQHDSSDYIFSICKTFFIHTKIFMGEIVFALKKKKQSMTAFITGRKNNSLILFSQKTPDTPFPTYFCAHVLQSYFKVCV